MHITKRNLISELLFIGLGLAIVVAVTSMSGCASMMAATDRGAQKIAEGVERYCFETPGYSRQQFRQMINEKLPEGTSIVVTCQGDPSPATEPAQ